MLQAILGQLLLVLAGFAVVLLAVILLLIEIELILRLVQKLARCWSSETTRMASSRPTGDAAAGSMPEQRGGG